MVVASLDCVSTPVRDVSSLLDEARQNEVAAYAKHRESYVGVVGVVLKTGLDQFSQLALSGSGWGPAWANVTAQEDIITFPYVVLGGSRGDSRDVVKCYFGKDDADKVGRIARGACLTVHGRFLQYVHVGKVLALVLDSCRAE
jgi:hypothetical protein